MVIDEKRTVALVSKLILGLKKTHFSRERHAYPDKTLHISWRCRELCQEDAALLGDKMKSLFNQKCFFLSFMLCYEDMQHWSKHHSTVERGATGQNWSPLSLIVIDSIQYVIAKTAALQHISTHLMCPVDWRVCFQVLVVYFAWCTNLDMYRIHLKAFDASNYFCIW